jgi:hypothetical protein
MERKDEKPKLSGRDRVQRPGSWNRMLFCLMRLLFYQYYVTLRNKMARNVAM